MECQLAEETVQAFFGAWFVRRSAREAISFLSEDVSISGIEENEVAQGKAVMAEYLKQYIQKTPEPYGMKCTVLHKQPVTENVCNLVLHLTLRNAGNSWRLHGFFTLVQDQTAKWVICGLHLAEPRDRQQRALLAE